MHPLVNVYGKVLVESLDEIPDDLEHLVSTIKSSDVIITKTLTELEGGGVGEFDYIRLVLQLKKAYKSKRDGTARFVGILKGKLEQLNNSQRAVLDNVRDITEIGRKEMIGMQEKNDMNSPFYGTPKHLLDFIHKTDLEMRNEEEMRSKLKRKSPAPDEVGSFAMRRTDSPPTTQNLSPDAASAKKVCLCEGPSYGEMVLCDNEQCPVGWFHFSCVGLTSKPEGEWFCYQCT